MHGHHHRLHRKPQVSDPGMRHGTCVTARAVKHAGVVNLRWRRKQLYVSGKWPMSVVATTLAGILIIDFFFTAWKLILLHRIFNLSRRWNIKTCSNSRKRNIDNLPLICDYIAIKNFDKIYHLRCWAVSHLILLAGYNGGCTPLKGRSSYRLRSLQVIKDRNRTQT